MKEIIKKIIYIIDKYFLKEAESAIILYFEPITRLITYLKNLHIQTEKQ